MEEEEKKEIAVKGYLFSGKEEEEEEEREEMRNIPSKNGGR